MALTGFVQAAIAAQKRQVSPPVSHTRERERIALTENGQLWSERDGPANCTCGDTKFDLTGRGNPLEAPDGHLWGPAPSVAAVRFQGLTASNGAVLAWTEKELYGWGCGQTLNLRDREALFLPTVLWRLDELDDDSIMHVEFVDRATIIITQRGRLFAWGFGHWGACSAECVCCEDAGAASSGYSSSVGGTEGLLSRHLRLG